MARRLTIEVAIDSRKARAGGAETERALQGVGLRGNEVTKVLGGVRTALLAMGTAAVIGGIIGVSRAFSSLRDTVIDSIGRASVEFASFDQALRNVGAVSGATREELAALGDEALRLAKLTRFSPEETARALYSLASAGLAAKEQIAALPAVLDFAEAAQADLGLSTELVVRNLKSFNLGADQSVRVADVLTASIGASALNAERLSVAMAQAGPAASVLGQDLETTVAAVALLVDRMGSGEMAGAGFKQSLLTLMNQADDLGIQVQDSTGKFRGLVDIIRDLETSGVQGERILAELGTRAGPAMAILVSQGSAALEDMRDRITSNGQAAQVAAEQLDTLQGDMDQFASAQDEFWKILGKQFEDGTRTLTRSLSVAVSEMTSLAQENGQEIGRAWLAVVEVYIDGARTIALAIARVMDSLDALAKLVGGMRNLLPPAMNQLADLAAQIIKTTSHFDPADAGRFERGAASFFDALEEGAKRADRALDDLNNTVVDGFQLWKSLGALGIEATNLRDLDQLNRIIAELDQLAAAGGRGGVGGGASGGGAAGAVDELARALEKLRDRQRDLATEIGQLNTLIAAQRDLFATMEGRGVDLSIATESTPIPGVILTDADIRRETEKYRELFGDLDEIHKNYLRGLQEAFSDTFTQILRDGELDFKRFFESIAEVGSTILAEQLSAALTRALAGEKGAFREFMQFAQSGAGKSAAAMGTISNIQNAQNSDYAAIGAVVGAVASAWIPVLGPIMGAWLGSTIGGMIKSGTPSLTGALEAELGDINIAGSIAQAGNFAEEVKAGIERVIDALGGELGSIAPGIEFSMRKGLAVIVDGVRRYFDEDHLAEGIQFAIVEALKRADVSGISGEARAALENTVADSMEELLSDLDFAKFIEQLDLGDAGRQLDDFVDAFEQAWSRMVELGIDGADRLERWAVRSLEAQRNAILGIQETAEERIRREAADFNAQLLLIRAQQEAKRADLLIQRSQLEVEASIVQVRADLGSTRLAIDHELLRGERDLLRGKLHMLEAVDTALAAVDALLASLPDLISQTEIEDAIRRAGRGGGRQRREGREGIRDEVERFGLDNLARQLLDASQFTERFRESLRGLGFSAEEAARLIAAAGEEGLRQLAALGEDAIGSLGLSLEALRRQYEQQAETVEFLRRNHEQLGLTMAEVAQVESELSQQMAAGFAGRLASMVEDEGIRRELEQQSHALRLLELQMEFELIRATGLVAAETLDLFQRAINSLRGGITLGGLPEPGEPEVAARNIQRDFGDAARSAADIAESFARAKASLADSLNRVLVGEFGGVSPLGGIAEAQRQYDEVLRQAQTGNIGAISELGDYGSTLLRLARDAYASSPQFEAIRQYVLSTGADILALKQGREGNVVFDERFYQQGEHASSQREREIALMERIAAALERQQWRGPIVSGGVQG